MNNYKNIPNNIYNIYLTRKFYNYNGFTLVELIVVVTILVILGTIGFISLQGFSSSARDSVRIENLSNLHKGLALFNLVSGTYPMPENPVAISASGVDIGYQGFAKDKVGNIAKLSKGGTIDPLDPSIAITYSVNVNTTKMQLMSFLEDGSNITSFVSNTYAGIGSDYSKRNPVTKGDTLGILLASGSLQPVQESGSGVDVVLTNSGYVAVFGKARILKGSGNVLQVLNDSMNNKPINLMGNNCCTFEDNFNNGFSLYAGGVSDVVFNTTGTVNHFNSSSKKSMYIKTSSALNGGGVYGGITKVLDGQKIIPGINYSISYYAKSLSGSHQIHFSIQGGSGDENCLSNRPIITSEWELYTFSCTLDIFKGSLYIYTRIPSKEFLIDNIRIIPTVLM